MSLWVYIKVLDIRTRQLRLFNNACTQPGFSLGNVEKDFSAVKSIVHQIFFKNLEDHG